MINNLFVLVHSYYEEYSPYYFMGPDNVSQAEFKSLCDSLLEKAGYMAVEKQRYEEYQGWVGWHEVVESMVPLLEKLGYRRFNPKTASYFGGGIIEEREETENFGKSSDIILNYNSELHQKIK